MTEPAHRATPLVIVRAHADVDASLVLRMVARDEQALGALYDRWHARARALALRIVTREDVAEEVVEEAFWQAWREASRFDADRGDVCAWLMTITRSRALDRVRADKRRPALGDDDVAIESVPSGDSPLAALEVEERATRVRDALAQLPREQREVLDLAYFDGLSQTEIAARTSAPLGTVKGRMRLAMEKLRACLSGLNDSAGSDR